MSYASPSVGFRQYDVQGKVIAREHLHGISVPGVGCGAAAVLAAYSHNLEYEHHSKVLGTDNGVLQGCKQSPGAASHRVDTQSSVMGVISFVPV